MKRGNDQRGINLLLAAMLLALGLYPVGAVSAQGRRFLSVGERATQAETSGSIRYVKPNGSTTGECQSWDTACDLQTALAAAISGDELWVARGIYTPGASGVVTATFQLKSGVEIYGGFAGDESALGQRSWTAHPTILSGDIDQNDVTESGVVTNTAQIKGKNAYHVVSSIGITSTAVLDGFTITAGNAKADTASGNTAGYGGGMYNDSSSPTLTNVTFSGNSADIWGGGMINYGSSSPTLTDVIFSGNSAMSGGGMFNRSSATLTDVTFSGNSATYAGGGMYNRSSATLTDVTFSGNSTDGQGGGMYNMISPTLTNVTFAGNSASSGGGMYNYEGRPVLMNVTFSGNSAPGGGGMYNYDGAIPNLTNVTFSGNSAMSGGGMLNMKFSSPTLNNVTFSGNSTTYAGGGMLNEYGSFPTLTNVTFSGNSANFGGGMCNNQYSSPSLTNAILWGNTPAENQIYNASGTPVVTYSDIQVQAGGVYSGTGNINRDPLFVDAASGNQRLQSNSPAIDAGDNAAPRLVGITTDLDGNPRFVDVPGVADTGSGSAPIVDMGAYEHPYVSVQIFLPLLARH